MKKYELLPKENGVHRIRALKDFADVKAGDVGGFVEDGYNLSHAGDCWIYDDAMVVWEAYVCNDAKVMNNAIVNAFALIQDNVKLMDNAIVSGHCSLSGKCELHNSSKVYGRAYIGGNVKLFHNSEVYGDAYLDENVVLLNKSSVHGRAVVRGNVYLCDTSEIAGCATVIDDSFLTGNVYVGGGAIVVGYSMLSGNARVINNGIVCDGTVVDDTWVQDKGNVRISLVIGNSVIGGRSIVTHSTIVDGVFHGCSFVDHDIDFKQLKSITSEIPKRGVAICVDNVYYNEKALFVKDFQYRFEFFDGYGYRMKSYHKNCSFYVVSEAFKKYFRVLG